MSLARSEAHPPHAARALRRTPDLAQRVAQRSDSFARRLAGAFVFTRTTCCRVASKPAARSPSQRPSLRRRGDRQTTVQEHALPMRLIQSSSPLVCG